jgi:hypothetical protein
LFVQIANNPQVNPRPNWIQAGNITSTSFENCLALYLRQVGGGMFGSTLIAPNTSIQYGNVRERIRDIEMDPFIQECLQQLPQGTVLGALGEIRDTTTANTQPLNRQPPPAANARLIFH